MAKDAANSRENSQADDEQEVDNVSGSSSHSDELRDSTEELENLREGKKRAEIKLELLKRSYEEELTSINDLRIEYIFKNSGAKEYLDRLRDRNKTKDDIIKSLKDELEFRCKEIAELREKVAESERRCNKYMRDLREVQARNEQLESERRSGQDRDRRLHLGHMSSASSLADNPPMPLNFPSMNEILMGGSTSASRDALSPFNDLSFASSIPPPPPPQPIDVPLHEILQE